MTSTAHKLKITNLHKRYGDNEVLKGVSLHACAGDVIALIGSSGSGKSTLLRCINLLERPNQGSIEVAGEEMVLVKDKQGQLTAQNAQQLQRMRTKLAMVFQHFNLWAHMTVLENIIEAPVHVLGVSREQAIQTARHYLQQVDLAGVEDRYPLHLSGGQQQRVAIARALAVEPAVMLFDEPTSALDNASVERVGQAIAALPITRLVFTHRLGTLQACDRIIVLDQGRIVQEGRYDALVSEPGFFQQLLTGQPE